MRGENVKKSEYFWKSKYYKKTFSLNNEIFKKSEKLIKLEKKILCVQLIIFVSGSLAGIIARIFFDFNLYLLIWIPFSLYLIGLVIKYFMTI